jgi:hypothetical protein
VTKFDKSNAPILAGQLSEPSERWRPSAQPVAQRRAGAQPCPAAQHNRSLNDGPALNHVLLIEEAHRLLIDVPEGRAARPPRSPRTEA